MTPVEIMALCVAVLVLVKLSVVFTNPEKWLKVAEKVYSGGAVLTVVSLIGAGVCGYYLLQELSIVQIFAVTLLFTFLSLLGVAAFSNELQSLARQVLTKEKVKGAWLSGLVWVVLSVWVLWVLFS